MTDTAAYVDIQAFVKRPVRGLLLDRIYRQPRNVRLPTQCHVGIEIIQVCRVVGKPGVRIQRGVEGHLKGRVFVIDRIFVPRLFQVVWENLVLW
jgi:hypothetical protein